LPAPLQSLAAEFAITIGNGEVWLSVGLALLLGGVCLLFGIWVARTVGLLQRDASVGETIGVGLASGLMVLAAWWAAIWSGGRSSFTPVAVGFAIAIAFAVAHRARRLGSGDAFALPTVERHDADDLTARRSRRRSILLSALAGSGFVLAVALLYGSTMVPSPRDGVQPVENRDEAFYAILARDLATTGTETNTLPSGFSEIPGAPAQLWYHWGELWLASAVITIFGAAPLAARYFIVLPVVLLAAAALTGSFVSRMSRTNSPRAYALGFAACLFLAPVALIPGPFFSSWAVGMIFGITLYGMGAVAALFALYAVAILSARKATWGLAAFVGSGVGFILPAHLAIALLALVGTGGVWAIRILQAFITTHRLPDLSPVWARTLAVTGLAVVATVVWGTLTSHGVGISSSTGTSPAGVSPSTIISPFNATWRASVVIPLIGAGAFLAIPFAWFLRRRDTALQASLYLGTMGLLFAGAIGWGARLGDFTMFYLFFAGIAVFATPVAAVAVRNLWERLRATQHRSLAAGLIVLCVVQLELGLPSQVVRLQGFGPLGYEPIPLSLLQSIRQLPADAKLAYSCQPDDEVVFATPQLVTIDARTDHRVVPMCFEAELANTMLGAEFSKDIPSQFFKAAPQMALYPNAAADPSSAAVAAFLKDHGIDYIYADVRHPNTLVDDAVPIATSGDAKVLRIP
jgi:hypothetical protein